MGLLDRLPDRRSASQGPAAAPTSSHGAPALGTLPRFAVLDLETTGLNPASDRILEIAILRADAQGRPLEQWVSRVNPDRPVGATHVHGLTDADVAAAPRFAELARVVGDALQGMVVVAHNAEFDLGFLQAEFARAGLPMPRLVPYCTLQGSTLYLPHLRRRTLAECCAALGVPLRNAHSALGDAFAAAGLLERYLAMDAQTGYDAALTATRARIAGERLAASLAGPTGVEGPTEGLPTAGPETGSARSPLTPSRPGSTTVAPPAPTPPAPASAPTAPSVTANEISPAAVRAWARSQGIPVGDRGRLRAELVAQYREAMDAPGSGAEHVAASAGPAAARPAVPAPAPADDAASTAPPSAAPTARADAAPTGPTPSATPPAPLSASLATPHAATPPSAAPTRPLTITDEFAAALDHLHAGHHLFLTGKAGTGKSTLIRHYLESTERTTITVAPTGIAALNVDGYTIHRLFSFPLGVTEEQVRGGSYYPGRFARALKELDTLIIDEASMVRADLFDALTAALELYGPRPGTPFGGVQLVLVGDLYQLPPVVTDHDAGWIERRYGTPFFFSAHSFDEDTFPVVELSTVFRQQGDDRLVDLLNAVREGTLLEKARAELNRRTDPDFEPGLDEFWLTLATTNRIVGARNRQMLERLPGPVQAFTAQTSGDTDGFEKPTEETLRIGVGAQVMLLNNDPLDRWVNGTLGRITAISADSDGPVVTVLLRDGRTEQVREHTWEITRPSVEGGALVHQVIGTFTQLPMKLAWAITIHKSQGQTLDRVVVDLTGGTFANGQLYVALSRCTSLEGLVLKREVLPRDLKTDQRVRRYLASGTSTTETLGEAYLSVLTVGTTGDRWRPRPVEIAVVTDDGDEISTVVNPTSDLFGARDEFGITTRDVQLAPLLAEAWPALSALLAGRVPVGVDIDRQLAHVDFELKRNGIVEPVPLGLEVPGRLLGARERARLNAPTALERARAVRDAVRRVRAAGEELPGSGMAFRQVVAGHGYLLARTTGPTGTSAPTGFVVGGNLGAQDDAAEVLAHLLEGTWQRVLSPDHEVLERLRGVEEHFGVRVLPEGLEATGPISAADVLVPGARVCFSGTVHSPRHGWLEKEQLHAMAEARGLRAVPTLTKTRTDVLVVAEAGSQSSKAKNAARWEKPVITAEEFLEWVG
ncbi:exonuclease domain-containing protein [Brachybacterium aquaticum]|uniref:DNA polymerase III epsilon subunit-like protein n=1 Tax=Brachybacterium aquaticum TaxID=1432564 RepID=A0A841AGN6_9MICO|nr:exonuclease domain-containing protein [Brachybacterium aquaticum]MBB5832495.1 DNA polymerase III epsilon subunit-like protein [Brachybacterium aquaticum]